MDVKLSRFLNSLYNIITIHNESLLQDGKLHDKKIRFPELQWVNLSK